MRKKIFAIALAIASLTGFSAFAQRPADCPLGPCQERVCERDPKACANACTNAMLFEGLDINDAQRQKICELTWQNDSLCRAARQENRAQCQRNDSTFYAQCRAAVRADKEKYLSEVKKVLGDKKYVTFLENYYLTSGNRGKGFPGDKGFRFKDGRGKGFKAKTAKIKGNRISSPDAKSIKVKD